MKLLIFPLKIEFTAFVEALTALGFKSEKMLIERIPVYTFESLNLRCAVGGHGKVQFAVQTQFLVNQLGDSTKVYCIGTSGTLSGEVAHLDVVVATDTVEHDFNLKFMKKEKPRFKSDADALAEFKSLRPEGFELHFGAVASGDEDVLDSERSQALFAETGALVTAWEGAGGARACKFLSVPYIEVRAVSDLADGSAPIDFKKFLAKSMANVASLVVQLPSGLPN